MSNQGPGRDRRDWLVVAGIVGGYGLAALLLSPGRDFAYLDDWAYARSVERLLAGGGLRPAEYSQPIQITHIVWGAALSTLLGPGFTALTIANLLMSLLAALALYALLRTLGFGPGLSALGVA